MILTTVVKFSPTITKTHETKKNPFYVFSANQHNITTKAVCNSIFKTPIFTVFKLPANRIVRPLRQKRGA